MPKEASTFYKPLERSVYPGYTGGNGFVENLCLYREGVEFWPDSSEIKTETLAFDIERHVKWDRGNRLLPFAYSMMIDGYYPVQRRPFRKPVIFPTMSDFDARVRSIPGFELDETRPYNEFGLHQYVNPASNIFVNWGLIEGSVCIGVIQLEPVDDLERVLTGIVPEAVTVFNQLSPTHRISPMIMDQAVAYARQASRITPRQRT